MTRRPPVAVRPAFMTRAMWFAYLLRSDVRAGAKLHDVAAQAEFVAWWLLFGQADYPAVWSWDEAAAAAAMRMVPAGPGLTWPRLLRLLHRARADLAAAFPIRDVEDLAAFYAWYRVHGPTQLPAAPALPDACLALTDVSRPGCRAPRMAELLKRFLPDRLPDAVKQPGADAALATWYAAGGWTLLPPPARPSVSKPVVAGPTLRRGGVNLIGYARGQSGLGEDVRMAAAALDSAGIPWALVDIPVEALPQNEDALADRIGVGCVYDVSLYCMSAFDLAGLFLRRGAAFFAGQYRIGYLPWELPRFPDAWAEIATMVDEIWTGSEYTAAAYRAVLSTPISCLPCPVLLPPIEAVDRSSLGLPNPAAYLFTYPFDPHSYLARKNPIALVRAFRRQFPAGDDGVALLLRVNGAPPDHPAWRALVRAIGGDRRIVVMAGTLSRARALGVLACGDCLVSPHRAEGFGRNIAEALLLGLRVLATNFAGCTDFIMPDEAIPCHTVPVASGAYPFAEGQVWAEPDPLALAVCLGEARDAGPLPAAIRGARAAAISRRYGADATGRAFAARFAACCVAGRQAC